MCGGTYDAWMLDEERLQQWILANDIFDLRGTVTCQHQLVSDGWRERQTSGTNLGRSV
jgi:hypothetical protein